MRVIRGTAHKLGWKRTKQALIGLGIALAVFNFPYAAFADVPNPAPADQPAATAPAPAPAPAAPTVQTNPATDPASAPAAPVLAPVLSLADPIATTLSNQPAGQQQSSANTSANNAASTTTATNNITGAATSGDASVVNNKKAGSATSGDANASANVLNIAGSTTTLGGNVNVFTQDIGDSDQDIIIDPNTLLPTSAGASNPGNSLQTNTSLTDLLNNINLSAQSGDASVTGNKKAGDATSGNANAIANIMNIIGSNIAAKNSFLGIINIYGNLRGDILVPKSFIDSLVAGDANPATAGANVTTTIDNNINATATSGDATVAGNKKAGDATSGNATSSVTVYNLTGQQVVAKNSLLVFVNVMGKWVGMIVPAPGSNSALLGGGVTQSSQNPQTAGGDSTTHITNNISVSAQSGDASVTGNKKAGDATSGNANAGVNLVNISNSDFQLGDWFGALFINVLGSWVGDFGIRDDTAATPPADGTSTPEPQPQDVKIFRFDSEAPVTPADSTDEGQDDSGSRDYSFTLASNTSDGTPSGHVLGSSTSATTPHSSSDVSRNFSFDLAALVAIVGALTLLFALGSLALRRRLGRGYRAAQQ